MTIEWRVGDRDGPIATALLEDADDPSAQLRVPVFNLPPDIPGRTPVLVRRDPLTAGASIELADGRMIWPADAPTVGAAGPARSRGTRGR